VSTIVSLADAVASQINDAPPGTFSLPFTAQRLHQPSFTLQELQDLRVSVVPRSVTVAAGSRDSSIFECIIDIGIQRRIGSDSDVDLLLDLAEQIIDHLRLRRLAALPDAAWAGLAHEPVVAAEHLDQHRQFTSVITVTYKVRR
jgi:hypothetical protein